jgi:PKD repeat protein
MAAPGYQIYSTMPGGGYGKKDGTSMASPHVAGTAALVLATYPGWSNDQVRTQLQATADDLGNPGRDAWYGFGLVDADEAAALPNSPPVADNLSVDTDEDTPVDITLTASDVDGNPLTYAVVTDPSHGTLGGAAPDLTYTPAPDYNGPDSFTFVANDGLVDSNVATVSITVWPVNDPPSASFDYSCMGLSCDFDASGSSDPEEAIASYDWDFGDGHTGSGLAPSHTYAAVGTYSVALTVTDDAGASDTDVQTVTVSEVPPSMHVGDLDGSLASANKKFWWAEVTITVHDGDEEPVPEATVQGTWSGGASGSGSCLSGADGTCTVLSPKITVAEETIAFVVDGVTHPTLPYQPAENHDPDGDSDGTSIVVSQASNQPPVAHFTYECSGLSCTFDGSQSSDPDGNITSYVWDFGDGETATGAGVSHTYAAEGTYPVLLTVTDNDGATDTESQNVPVGVGPGTMFVFDISMSGKSAGPNRSATAVVTIHDTDGSPVAGATVHGTWSGDYGASVSGVTAADGTAVFSSGKVRQANATFTFTVEDVVHDGFTYDPGLNNESSATLVMP